MSYVRAPMTPPPRMTGHLPSEAGEETKSMSATEWRAPGDEVS